MLLTLLKMKSLQITFLNCHFHIIFQRKLLNGLAHRMLKKETENKHLTSIYLNKNWL